MILGKRVGGVVTSVGAGVDGGLVGKRAVAGTGGLGGYAERAAVEAGGLVEVPDGLELDIAVALLADGRTATMLVRAVGLRGGDRVLAEAAAGDDGSLGLLDLGSVGRLDGTTRMALGQLMAALGRADSLAASDALLELVDRPDDLDEREVERAIGVLIVRYTAPGATTGAAAFTALFRLVTSQRLAVPPQVAAVFRTFATLEGTLMSIDPQFDLVAQTRETSRGGVAEAMEPQRLRRAAEDELAALLPVLRRLRRA